MSEDIQTSEQPELDLNVQEPAPAKTAQEPVADETSMTIEAFEALLATGWKPTRGAAIYPAKNLVVI